MSSNLHQKSSHFHIHSPKLQNPYSRRVKLLQWEIDIENAIFGDSKQTVTDWLKVTMENEIYKTGVGVSESFLIFDKGGAP